VLRAAMDAIAGCFARRETRATAAEMITGLLTEMDTRTCWTLAEALGHPGPHRLRHLIPVAATTSRISAAPVPPVQAIADYLGLDEAICLICWQTPVERAHVVPQSLGGSNDMRNFALLCPRHHREAPDVADAEAFWSWVDYVCDRKGHMKWEGVAPELLERAERIGLHLDTAGPVRRSVHHFDRVRDELVRHYVWTPEDLAGGDHWGALMKEFHTVQEAATGTHFNVPKKASTEAWAFVVARRRLRATTADSSEADTDHSAKPTNPAVAMAERTALESPRSKDARRLADAARRAEATAEAIALLERRTPALGREPKAGAGSACPRSGSCGGKVCPRREHDACTPGRRPTLVTGT
jgi:hypothetical protein